MPTAKNKRKAKFTDSSVAAKRNVLTEIKKAEKKYLKLVARNEKGLKRTPAKKKIWSDDRKMVMREKEIPRLQGFKPGSSRCKKLKDHINRLKHRLNQLNGTA